MKRLAASFLFCTLFATAAIFSSAATFQTLNLPLGVGTATCVATEGSTVFVGTTAGFAFYETTTQLWTLGKKPIDDKNIVSIAASGAACMAVTDNGWLYYSDNRGTDWTQVHAESDFTVATTVVFHGNQFVVGAANGAFIVDAMKPLVTKVCANQITGSVLSIALLDDQMVVVQNGQSGRSVIINDGSKCTDVTDKSDNPIIPVQGAYYDGKPMLLDEHSILQWDVNKTKWLLFVDLGQGKPAKFINIDEANKVAVVGHGTFINLIDLNTATIIGPEILGDLAPQGGVAGPGGFIAGRWIGIGELGPLITNPTVREIVDEQTRLDEEFFVELVDDVPTLLANVPYKMYSVQCDERRLISSGNLGGDGRVRMSYSQLGADSNDVVEFEVIVRTDITDKLDRVPGFDTLCVQTIRNRTVNTDGSFTLPFLKDIRNQRVTLGHSMIGFRFMVAVEWDADNVYIDTLKSWMQLSNKVLADVTDGQAYIERVHISDAKERWGAKDIAFMATNTEWPHVNQMAGYFWGRPTQILMFAAYMPRAHYGQRSWNRDATASADWLETVGNRTVSTLVHELGHHVFGFGDEYSSVFFWNNTALEGAPQQGRCFGLMHYNYFNSNQAQTQRMSSELSADRTAWSTGGGDFFSATIQFTTFRRPCWEYFRDCFTRNETIAGTRIRSRILRPVDRTLAPGDSIIIGPNDVVTMQNTCMFQEPMQIIDQTVNVGARNGTVAIINGGIGVPDIDVDLLRSTSNRERLSYQGKSAVGGGMRVLGIRPGNIIKVWGHSAFDVVTSAIARSSFGEIIVPSFATPKKGDAVQQDVALSIDVATKDITSRRIFNVIGSEQLTTSIEVTDGSALVDTKIVRHDVDPIDCKLTLQTTNGSVELPLNVAMMDASSADKINSFSGRAEFFKEPDKKLPGTRVSIADGYVPPPFNGISDGEELLSDLVSIGSDGSLEVLRSMQIAVWHAPAKGKFAVTHKWDKESTQWKPLASYLNEDGEVVSSSCEGAGTYAVFSRPENIVGVDETNESGTNVYPNPASSSITITLSEVATSVTVCNFVGSPIVNIEAKDGLMLHADVHQLVPGLYYIRVERNGTIDWIPFVVER